jgi:L-asparaginase
MAVHERFSGVINLEDVKNPIHGSSEIAWIMMTGCSVGRRCSSFFPSTSFRIFRPNNCTAKERSMKQKLDQQNRKGTVGCVALDGEGNLAAATSTGGKGFEIPWPRERFGHRSRKFLQPKLPAFLVPELVRIS